MRLARSVRETRRVNVRTASLVVLVAVGVPSSPAIAACDDPLPQVQSVGWRRAVGGDPSWLFPRVTYGGAAGTSAGDVFVLARFMYNLPVDPLPFVDVGVVRLGPAGDVAWTTLLDDPAFAGLTGVGIALAPDGGVVVTADARADSGNRSAVAALDATGAPRWAHALPDAYEPLVAVDSTGAAGLAMFVGGDENRWRIDRYLADGTLAWTRFFGFDGSPQNRPTEIAAGADGSLFVAGGTRVEPDAEEFEYILKYDAAGMRTWAVVMPQRVTALLADAAGGIHAATTDQGRIRIVALAAADGSVLWERIDDDQAVPIRMAAGPGGRIVVAGFAGSAALLSVYEGDGTPVWRRTWRNPGPYGTGIEGLAVDAAGSVRLAVSTTPDRVTRHDVLRYDAAGALVAIASFENLPDDSTFPSQLLLDGADGVLVVDQTQVAEDGGGFADQIDVVGVPAASVPAMGVARVKKRVKFGRLRVAAEPRTRTATLKNKSKTDRLLVCVDAAPPPFDGAGGTYLLEPKTKLGVALAFDPDGPGAATASLAVRTSDPARPEARITLTGAGR